MKAEDLIFDLRRLLIEDRFPQNGNVSRVGRIIRRFRPGIATVDGTLNQPASDLLWLHQSARDKAEEIVANHSAAIGRIEVQRPDQTWLAVGTGWVTSAGGPGENARIVTAGHVACHMLKPDFRLARRLSSRGFSPEIFRPTRICFADDPTAPQANDITANIATVIWPHTAWDMMICELDQSLAVTPPPIEEGANWQALVGAPVAVLGYPIQSGDIPPALGEDGFVQVFEGKIGVRRLSPGIFTAAGQSPGTVSTPAHASHAALLHDASTLGGNSGSPVFSLESGNIVGIHTDGGSFFDIDDPQMIAPTNSSNRAIPLPWALMEKRLQIEIENAPNPEGIRANAGRYDYHDPKMLDANHEARSLFTRTSADQLPVALLTAVVPDRPDTRDYYYTPPLAAPRNEIPVARDLEPLILNQGAEPACVGFAMAALINHQRRHADPDAPPVSARMLYEMALTHDEWLDKSLGGTSLRAGIKGFYYSGACTEENAPFISGQRGWRLTRAAAKDARGVMPGAYYRLRHQLVDFQAAIQDAGAIIISANIHEGWFRKDGKRVNRIDHRIGKIGQHAFIAIGYDEKGFIIQNSWGRDWGFWKGHEGLAHWSYEDWAENVTDAWVLRLAPSAPSTFGLQPMLSHGEDTSMPRPLRRLPRPHRYALLGHIVHVERDQVIDKGRLGLGLTSLLEAAQILRAAGPKQSPHLLLVYHDPFLGSDAISRVAAHMTPTLMRNGIFPLHIAYGVDEVGTVSARMMAEAALVSDRFGAAPQEASGYLERRAGRLCGRLIRDFIAGAAEAARPGGALWQAHSALCQEARKGRGLSAVSFGAGSIAALTHLLPLREQGNPRLDRLLLVGGVGQRPTPQLLGGTRLTEWQLPHQGEAGALPAYVGDWSDLVQMVQGTGRGPRAAKDETTLLPQSIAACCVDSTLLNGIIAQIKGRAPSPTNRFYEI